MLQISKMDRIEVGVGVIISQDKRLLFGKRLSAHGQSQWSFPGGHVEFGEKPEDAAIRETFEETSLTISKLRKVHFTSDVFENGKHYVTLYFLALEWNGTVKNMEPEKCEGWQWFDPINLPDPLFRPIESLLDEVNLTDILKLR
jgi:8-oxo-dGTP diphosphatase